MGQLYEGEIQEIYNNFGMIKSTIDDHDIILYFNIFSDMVTQGHITYSERITFKIKNIEIRNSKVNIAYNVQSIPGSKPKKWKSSSHKYDKLITKNHYTYLFKELEDEERKVTQEEIMILIDYDKKMKSFFLKWILFIEEIIKNVLLDILSFHSVSDQTIYRVLNKNSKTRGIIKKQFRKILNRYMFKPEYSKLKLGRNDGDSTHPEIVEAPISLFLEGLTLIELGEVMNQLVLDINLYDIQIKNEYKFLMLVKESFLELAYIRNSSAHGNPLLPILVDKNFNANYFFDMASVFPSWNSKDNVEKWDLFNFIRFTTRSLYKQGIPLINLGSPQLSALAFTKSLLINPVKRSFFMFFYVQILIFAYLGIDKDDEFWEESQLFLNHGDNNKHNFLDEFPTEEAPLKIELTRLIFPLLYYVLLDDGLNMFKVILESSMDIPEEKSILEQ